MKPIIKNGVAIISPQGFLDSSNVDSVLSLEEVDMLTKQDINALFISLKSIVFFNATAIQMLSDLFIKHIMNKKSIGTGFCDYDKRKYLQLVKYLNNDPKVTLLESTPLVSLFYGSESHVAQRVLVWNENATQKGMIIYKLLERGCSAVAANSKDEYIKPNSEYDYKVENCYLGSANDNIQHYTRSNMVVYVFTGFLDSEKIDSFDNISHRNYIRIGFRIFILDFTNVAGINTHAVNFLARLATTSFEYGAQFIITGFDDYKVGQPIHKELEDANIKFLPNMDAAFNDDSLQKLASNHAVSKNETKKTLTKQTIKSLNSIIEATIDTMEVMTKLKAQKLSIQMGKLNSLNESQFIASSIGFYGHIEGVIVLIFEKQIAEKACSILLGSDDVKESEILDAAGELVNITMGKARTSLSHKNLAIKMTLPRTFKHNDEILMAFGKKDGVVVDFLFNGKKFIFFLTI